MKSVRCKLKSNTGASITFALLLFLVCAVLSSAILVAGTAAAGRMAGLAETDQKYYSVTSAANMIKDLLDDQSVSKFTYNGNEYMFDIPVENVTSEMVEFYSYNSGSSELNSLSRLIAYMYFSGSGSTISLDAGSNDSLDTKADVSIDTTTDVVTLTVYDTSSKPYKLKMLFSASYNETNPSWEGCDTAEIEDPKSVTFSLNRIVTAFDASGIS